ncbi:MAG: hypothetical protein DRI65_04095 [Chloroflexota bacterium]|nr:MAG: hypothetical protein DRI65_04095 [Chloroflexota bacterium]
MPIIWTTISFAAGLIAADSLSWNNLVWILVGLIFSLFSGITLWFTRKRISDLPSLSWGLILAVILAFFLGGIRYHISLPDYQDPAYILNYAGRSVPVQITGVVVDYPDQRDQIVNLQIKAESIQGKKEEPPIPLKGLLLAKAPVETRVSYGDRVLVVGFLKVPPEDEDFNYREYLFRQSIDVYLTRAEVVVLETGQGSVFLGAIYRLKTKALKNIYRLWPDPEASLLAGILLGVESGISESVQKAFRDTGTTHIIAISGFNITIVAGFFSRFFSRIMNPRKGAFAALAGISIYTILVGADAAVVRAAVMGGLSIFAQQIGRRQHGLNAAALASLVMMLFNPQLPWDVSFQLSLSATLGLVLYADPLSAWFLRLCSRFFPLEVAQRITQPVSEFVLFTFAAQLTTLPVMIYHFHSFSLTTFLANPAILPVQPPIMVLGGLALILALAWFPLGKLAGPLAYPFVLFTIRVVEWFSRLPIKAAYLGQVDIIWIILFYAILLLVTFYFPLLLQLRRYLTPSLAASSLALLALIVWRIIFSTPDGKMHFYLLDVGTGSAIYLKSPSGDRVLINGGPSTKLLSDHLGRKLPPFKRDLDLVLVLSPQAQDLDALTGNLPRFVPEKVVWLGDPSLCWESENLRFSLDEDRIPLMFGEEGQTLIFRDSMRIHILSASSRGGTVLVEYGDFRAVLPYGITNEIRAGLHDGRDIGEVSVLLLADNGYQSSNPSVWIDNLHPQLILLSVGIKDSQGLPNRGLIDRLAGYSLLRTDQHGTIHLSTNGEKFWIRVERLD